MYPAAQQSQAPGSVTYIPHRRVRACRGCSPLPGAEGTGSVEGPPVCRPVTSRRNPLPGAVAGRPSELEKDSAAGVIKIKVALTTRALLSSDIFI